MFQRSGIHPFWLSTVILLLLFTLLTPPVYAHAVPVSSSPRPNTILETAPDKVSIQFSEPVAPDLSRITVLTQAGQEVETGVLHTNDDNTTLSVSLPLLNSGTYLVSWQVLSTVDGHTTNGSFSFGVGVTSLGLATGGTDTNVRISSLSIASRWATLLGIALLAGFYAFRLFVLPATISLDRAHLRLLSVGLILLGAGLLLTLIDQSQQFDLWQITIFQTWMSTRFGQMWLVRLFLTGLSGYLLVALWRGNSGKRSGGQESEQPRQATGSPALFWWFGLLLSLCLGFTNSMVSHSAALREGQLATTLVDLAHIAAASVWVGALLQLALTLWQSRNLPGQERGRLNLELNLNFSVLGAAAVGVLILSGSFLAYTHVASWTALVGTPYGLTLMTKIALALPPFIIAAINLLVIKPLLAQAQTQPAIVQQFSRLVRLETFIAILILLAAGILIELQRAADAPLLADDPGRMVSEYTVDDLNVTLAVEPALIGNNTFDIFLNDLEGNPIDDSEVTVRFTFLGQSLGADEGEAIAQGNGHYQLQGSYISLIGEWQIEVAIRQPGTYDSFAPYRLEAGLGGTIRPLESTNVSWGERFARFMTIMSGGVTGIFFILFGLGWLFLARKASRYTWQLVPLSLMGLFMLVSGVNQTYTFFTQSYTPAKFLTNSVLPDSQSIAAGDILYQDNCAMCHGTRGLGDGPNAIGLNPAPVNFTAGHTVIHSDGDLFYWIQNGIAGSAMPAYKSKLSEEETWHLVNYVRRLGVQTFP